MRSRPATDMPQRWRRPNQPLSRHAAAAGDQELQPHSSRLPRGAAA